MKKYDSYKESGVEWIGEIPSHWDITRIKYKFQIGRGRVISNEDLVEDAIYPVYSSQTLNNGCLGYIETFDFDDKLITWTTDGANAGTVFLREGKFNCTNVCGTLKGKSDDVIPEFDYYFLQYATQFYKRPDTNGAKIMNNEMAVILSLKLSTEEQTAIAKYLDHKTTQIDNLIAKKEQFIQLLEEERVAVINQAVTKGLDPTVPMKDSGIEWLGEIPEHWESYRIDWVANIVRGNTGFRKDELLDSGEYVALQYGKTYKVDIVDNSFNFFVNSEFYKESQIVTKGDTILISTSETFEDLGHTCFYINENDGLLGGEQILLKPNRTVLNEKYLYQYVRQFCRELQKYAKGLKVFRFSTHDLKQIFIGIPTIEEQIKIVDFLDIETIRIDSLTSKMEKEIELLKEYKTALISEVVTGKVDVRYYSNK